MAPDMGGVGGVGDIRPDVVGVGGVIRPVMDSMVMFHMPESIDYQRLSGTSESVKVPQIQGSFWRRPDSLKTDKQPSYKVGPENICIQDETALLYIVPSTIGDVKQRRLIRNTWGASTMVGDYIVQTVFVLGMTDDKDKQAFIEDEAQDSKDVIIMTKMDTESTSEKVSAGMDWVVDHCQETTMVAVIPSEVNYVEFISLLTSDPTIFCTKMESNAAPVRNPTNKYYVKNEEYPDGVFPPYCQGDEAYAIPGKLLNQLHVLSKDVKPFKYHDVYWTGILPTLMGGVKYAEIDREKITKDKTNKSS